MSDNTIKTTDVNNEPVKKTPAKKAAAKKAVAKEITKEDVKEDVDITPRKSDAAPNGVKEGYSVIVFESGISYTSYDYSFTQDNRIQEVPNKVADQLLALDNFRLPSQFEIEDYFANKEA